VRWLLKAANGRGSASKRGCNSSLTNRARFSPLRQRRRRKLTLLSEFGEVELVVDYGQDPQSGQWGCPLKRAWGVGPHQKLLPGLTEKLCFTVTATGCYEEAAAVASKWGVKVDDAKLHALVQRTGARAEAQIQQRLAGPPPEREPKRAATPLAVLLVDGWQVRQRGPGWGRSRSKKPHVEWHELKTGVFYRHEQAAQTKGGRGLLAEKIVVSWQGEPGELGRRLNWEALRGGLGRARQTLFLGDGAAWIWNLQQDRWASAMGLLDFYHGSEHLWALGEACCGPQPPELARWVEPRLHQLRHGQEQKVLAQIGKLKRRRGMVGETIKREQNYFATHAGRMNYQTVARRGWPIGSGAVESACRQKQCRFKRPGQFWTASGLRNLCALDEARRNHHWDQLWNQN
jgi:hypothetical protein